MKLTSSNLFCLSLEAIEPSRSQERQALLDAGCQSNWITLAVKDHPIEGKKLVELYTKANSVTSGKDDGERAYDELCNSWYGQNEKDRLKLIKDTTKTLNKIIKQYQG